MPSLAVVLAGAKQHTTPTAMRDVAREAEDRHDANRENVFSRFFGALECSNTEESTSHRREDQLRVSATDIIICVSIGGAL
jgi:hypothetical protein